MYSIIQPFINFNKVLTEETKTLQSGSWDRSLFLPTF